MYFYGDNSAVGAFQGDVWKMDAKKHYLTHFDNYLFLSVLSKEGTFQERGQVEKEMAICERKLKFWEQHPNFDKDAVRIEKEKKVRDWKGRA